jgi:hypothetical protein
LACREQAGPLHKACVDQEQAVAAGEDAAEVVRPAIRAFAFLPAMEKPLQTDRAERFNRREHGRHQRQVGDLIQVLWTMCVRYFRAAP